MIKACVIGHPISHSKSPLIHNYWIKKQGLKGLYDKHDINPDNLLVGVNHLIGDDYAGFNVTVPHKQEIMSLCTEIDNTAQKIGAVNTVKIIDGKLYGRNTDAFGFIENISQTMPAFDFSSGPAFVIGAGGAARAVVYGLLEAGVPLVKLTNRSEDKALELQKINPACIDVIKWDQRMEAIAGSAIIVNTTSLGMTGQPRLDISLKALSDKALVCDIVYAPLMTDLLLQAKEQGHDVVTGIGMLLHQARPAFEAWFGILPSVDDELQKLVLGA